MNRFPDATPIDLDDLPTHSDWPDRILGATEWTIPERDIGKICEEYEHNKYERLLKFQKNSNTLDPAEIRERQIIDRTWHFSETVQSEKAVCISQDCDLYVAPILAAQRYNDSTVVKTFEHLLNGGETVVELGCGYGYNLHVLDQAFPTCKFVGGELSENAVKIASKLYEDRDNIAVKRFNYYDDQWPLFARKFKRDVVVFTRLSIEQLPRCGQVIERLRRSAGEPLREVVHLEPVYEMHDTGSLLQLLRKRYIEINDYNRDLLSVLESSDKVSILEREYDVFGFNGLNPMSLIHWKPT